MSDDGRGMTAEERTHAFDRFYRGRGEGQPGGRASRPGDRRSLVELHGGDVSIESAPDQGHVHRAAAAHALADPADAAPRHALRGRRVLVVDDEPEIAELIAERLTPYEFECVLVNDGAHALERLQSEHFDAITLDILMPA